MEQFVAEQAQRLTELSKPDAHVLDCTCENCKHQDKVHECTRQISGVPHDVDCECSDCVTDSDDTDEPILPVHNRKVGGLGKGLMGRSPLVRQNAVFNPNNAPATQVYDDSEEEMEEAVQEYRRLGKRKVIDLTDEPEPAAKKARVCRLRGKLLCITVPQTGDAKPKDIADAFIARCPRVVGKVVVVRETHKDGNYHHHLYAEAQPGKKFDFKGNFITIGDVTLRFNSAKTHSGGAKSEKGWVKYMLKTLDLDALDQSENFWSNIADVLEWLEDPDDIITKVCAAATPVEAIRCFAEENCATDAIKVTSQIANLWQLSHAANPSHEMNKIQAKWGLAHYDERVTLLAAFIRRWVLTPVTDERQPVLIFVGPSRVGKTAVTRSFLEFLQVPYCYFRQSFSWAILRDHPVQTGPILLDDIGDDDIFGWPESKKPPTAFTERNTVITVTDKYAKKFQIPLIGRACILLCNKVPQWVVARQNDSMVEPAYWGEITGNINILSLPDLRPLFFPPEHPEYEAKSPISSFFD